MCAICNEFGNLGCPCCRENREKSSSLEECECCEGLGFLPYYKGHYISTSKYHSLSDEEMDEVDKNEECDLCGGAGYIIVEK